ncbi:MAG TPA: pitrilysin family protein [Allosphingosinicella sp.]|jgi:zinc protease|uniref:M16 family metallopeptidase n=1 Tax=Allosphingosinicella sp. TaxID=2823234 RepID=UPI002F28E471
MRTKLGLLLAAATIGLIAGAAPAAAAQGAGAQAPRLSVPPLAYKMRKLKNGLTVYTLRDKTTPNVSVSVWYEVGAKHDPAGRSGFAHMFEHILSRKTVNMPYNMINKLTEDVGGVRNASTSWDRTNYYETVPGRYLETMLWTHAERMARPVVDAEVFEKERNIVKEELRQRVLAPPYGRLFSFVSVENAWDKMPHRRPTIGSIADLDAAKLEDARAFHEAFYGPDTASLIIAGNFDEAKLAAWVDTYFGSIPARARKTSLAITERDAPRTKERLVTAYAPNVPLPVVGSLWQTPGSSHADIPALRVLSGILSDGNNSRLYQALVQKGIATSASSNLIDTEESGFLGTNVIMAGGRAMPDAETVLANEIERMRAQQVTAAELTEAKNELIADALRERETFQGRAFALGEALVRTGDPRAPDKELAAIQRVTAADVQRVARKYLAPNARVAIRYVNEKERPAGQTGDSWANPTPLPVFKSVPPATRPANALAPEGQRQQPPAPGAAVPVTPPTIAESKLANGLTLVTAKTGNVPIATMTMVMRGGASTDPRGKAGLATLAADLATRGTTTRTAQRIAIELESLGASINSGAGPDGITVSVSAPATNLEAAGRVLADIVQNASFPADEVERQRTRAIDSLGVAMRDPGALASMVVQPVAYGTAPYGALAGGTVTSLKGLTREDLAGQYRTWWHPANAALVVSGGIDPQATAAMAQRLFAGWRGQGPAPVAPTARAGEAQKVRTVVIDLPGAGQAAVIAAVRGINRADPDYYNLVVANAILGSGSNGRLFEEVRTKRALSYGANSSLPARADQALLTASAQTKNESAADVAKIFLDELDRLGKQPLTAEEIEKRKAFVSGLYTLQSETSAGFGATLAGLIQQGLSPSEAVRYLQNIETVSPAAASKAAARLSAADRATLVIVGDSSKFIDKLRALRPDVEVIPADQLNLDVPALKAG